MITFFISSPIILMPTNIFPFMGLMAVVYLNSIRVLLGKFHLCSHVGSSIHSSSLRLHGSYCFGNRVQRNIWKSVQSFLKNAAWKEKKFRCIKLKKEFPVTILPIYMYYYTLLLLFLFLFLFFSLSHIRCFFFSLFSRSVLLLHFGCTFSFCVNPLFALCNIAYI